jgi:ribosomal protein S18 acetylase RimI-like enzyme
MLVAAFRVALSSLRGKAREMNVAAAEDELQKYIDKMYPIFIAVTDEAQNVGYLACKVDGNTVWAESLFVSPEFRRRGVAGMLYDKAEELARAHGQETLYNWIHPNNGAIISFLRKRGYNVLNLIEVRRPRTGDTTNTTFRIGDHDYAY